jgi:hypothetical protein
MQRIFFRRINIEVSRYAHMNISAVITESTILKLCEEYI